MFDSKYNELVLFFPLLEKGRWARAGKYVQYSLRTLRFDVKLWTKVGINYDTLESNEYTAFSMCGSTTKNHCGDQGIDRIVEMYRDRVPQDDIGDFDRLTELWRTYHLNDHTAGTKRQEEAIAEWRKTHPDLYPSYDKICAYLDDIGLISDHGYKYGSDWLIKPIPQPDVDFVIETSLKYCVHTKYRA